MDKSIKIKRTSSKISNKMDNQSGPQVDYQVEPNYSVDGQFESNPVVVINDRKKNKSYLWLLIPLIIGIIIGYGLSNLMNQPEDISDPVVLVTPDETVDEPVDEPAEDEVAPVEPEYRRYVSITANSVEREDEFVYTDGGTANTGEHKTYQINTFAATYGEPWHTTEPIIDSVGHVRHINYDLAVWQDNEGDKNVESWLVIKAGTSSDPDYMELIKTTERMNCYSKPIEESVEIPEDAEYVYIEAQNNDGSGYLPLLTNDIYITVDD